MVHDPGQNLRLQAGPSHHIRLGHGDEVAAQEHPSHARQGENGRRERAANGRLGGREVGGAGPHHIPPGQELQGGGVGGAFGLDEHDDVPTAYGNRTELVLTGGYIGRKSAGGKGPEGFIDSVGINGVGIISPAISAIVPVRAAPSGARQAK